MLYCNIIYSNVFVVMFCIKLYPFPQSLFICLCLPFTDEAKQYPPAPLVMMYTNQGVLCSFTVVNLSRPSPPDGSHFVARPLGTIPDQSSSGGPPVVDVTQLTTQNRPLLSLENTQPATSTCVPTYIRTYVHTYAELTITFWKCLDIMSRQTPECPDIHIFDRT